MGHHFVEGLTLAKQLGISLFQLFEPLIRGVLPATNPGKATNQDKQLKNCREAEQSRHDPSDNTPKPAVIPSKPKATTADCTRRQEEDEEFYQYTQHSYRFLRNLNHRPKWARTQRTLSRGTAKRLLHKCAKPRPGGRVLGRMCNGLGKFAVFRTARSLSYAKSVWFWLHNHLPALFVTEGNGFDKVLFAGRNDKASRCARVEATQAGKTLLRISALCLFGRPT